MTELSLYELDRAFRLRQQGKNWEVVAKTLGKRKIDVMVQTKKYFSLPSPRQIEYRTEYGEQRLPMSHAWKRSWIELPEIDTIRRKRYPTWRWQYWVLGLFVSEIDQAEETLEGYSYISVYPEKERMKQEAINNAAPKDRGSDDPWQLKELLDEKWILWSVRKKSKRKCT